MTNTIDRARFFMYAIIGAIVMIGGRSLATASNDSDRKPAIPAKVLQIEPDFVSWLNEPWRGDDAPYASLRSKVENAERQGELSRELAGDELLYRKKPANLTVQFAYFYALWLNRLENDTEFTGAEQEDLSEFTTNLTKLHYPQTYNYTRLASLCWDCWSVDPTLLPFLERLVQRDPNDIVVAHLIPAMHASSDNPADQLDAIKEANELESRFPGFRPMRLVLGWVYYRRWLTTGDPTYGRLALIHYRSYNAVAPPNGDGRVISNWAIGRLKQAGVH